jgi:hypothetical protein
MLGTVAGPVAVAFCYVIGRKQFAAIWHVELFFALALAWSIAGLFFLNRGLWSAAMPSDVGISSGLQSCRREIERQRDLVRRGLLWSFGPIMLAIGAMILSLAMVGTRTRGVLPNALPFLVLVVVWIVTYFIIRVREQRDLQRAISELDEIENENRA